jgi:hypothetical protein
MLTLEKVGKEESWTLLFLLLFLSVCYTAFHIGFLSWKFYVELAMGSTRVWSIFRMFRHEFFGLYIIVSNGGLTSVQIHPLVRWVYGESIVTSADLAHWLCPRNLERKDSLSKLSSLCLDGFLFLQTKPESNVCCVIGDFAKQGFQLLCHCES